MELTFEEVGALSRENARQAAERYANVPGMESWVRVWRRKKHTTAHWSYNTGGNAHHPGDLQRVVAWLVAQGLRVEIAWQPGRERAWWPRIWVDHGGLVAEPWVHLGDVIHEAGHLAQLEPARRALQHVSSESPEAVTCAWATACCLHLGVPSRLVVENGFFDPDEAALTDHQLRTRPEMHPGVHGLVELGMLEAATAYPHLTRWVL